MANAPGEDEARKPVSALHAPPPPSFVVPKRAFGPGPFLLGMRRVADRWGEGFPFDVPAFEQIDGLSFDQPVTLLAGDNGTGKSTMVETIAESMGFSPQGGEMDRAGELPAKPRPVLPINPDAASVEQLMALEPILSGTRPRNGYFLRAESFFNIAEFVDGGSKYAPDLSLYGDRPLHEQSHGQSFLALAANRFGPGGLYLLDEPEAALSVTGALALLAIIDRAARAGAQFIIATHSPILLACPGARIYELDDDGAAPCSYDALDSVRTTRAFLDAPERFIRAALAGD